MSLIPRHSPSQPITSPELRFLSPGIWHAIHETSLKDPSLSAMLIKYYSLNFFCDHCRGHMNEHIQKNPIDRYRGSLFHWTVDFHNSVNKRLGKKIMTYEEALSIYSREGSEGCSSCTVDAIDHTNGHSSDISVAGKVPLKNAITSSMRPLSSRNPYTQR